MMKSSFDIFVETFDADRPYMYLFMSVLLFALFRVNIHSCDLSFLLMNIVLYTAITTTIFYAYTKSEKRKITEKYVKDVLSLLYDTDIEKYNELKKQLRETPTKSNKDISFIKKYITLLLGLSFVVIFSLFYLKNRNKISITSVGRNAYYLLILGLTELFLTFFVITRIPLPNVVNLMDTFIRRREQCSKENIKEMVSEDIKKDNCDNFKKSGDSCVVNNIHKFECNSGRINRTRYNIEPVVV